jgi:hypothetical protein
MKSILRKHTRQVERMNRFERRLAVSRKLREMFPDYRGVYKFTEYQFIDYERI